ncbi:MAG TPA: metalloregulator ArsR/SmtB family transcription factor [Coleofasciculaceae cyanobacterium]|jgi:DNA-binding transcriptional ArsR family regulator
MTEQNDNSKTLPFPAALQDNSIIRAKIFAALSDPTRLRIVELLTQCEEMSGTDIANRLEISLALFCHHSKTLMEAGLIKQRKDGQTKYNSLNRELLNATLTSLT